MYRVHTIIVIRCLCRVVVDFYGMYLLLAFLCDIIVRNAVYTTGKVYVYVVVMSHVYNIPSASGDRPFRSNLYICNNNKKKLEGMSMHYTHHVFTVYSPRVVTTCTTRG